MNETNLSDRQRRVLSILYKQELTRVQICSRLEDYSTISKPTLIRDLNQLIKAELVLTQGKGKGLTYSLTKTHELLRYIGLDDYFTENSILRQSASKSFKTDVFKELQGIINSKEKRQINNSLKSLSEQEIKLDSTIFRREIERFTIEFSWKSSKIEGNTYTLLETEALIKKMKQASGHSLGEAIMILNHKKAVDYVLANRQKFRKIGLSEVNQLHGLLTRDLRITPGLRCHPLMITGTVYTPLKQRVHIEKALRQLIRLINKTKNPLEKSVFALAMIAYIQPFADGNKRTSRMLSNAILLAHDLYPLSYRDLDEAEYIKALIIFYEQNNLYHLKRIFLEQVKFAAENYFRT